MAKGSFPPSVQPGIPKLPKTPKGWTIYSFGELLKEVNRPIHLESDKEYQLVVAKRSRGGIEAREKLIGRRILTKTQFKIKSGDFLISNRQIVHGACGIVPAHLDGSVVSNEYTVLHSNELLDLSFFDHFSHCTYFQQTCFQSSVGVDVEKMLFRLGEWFKYKINLPPLKEQKRIAEILSRWDRGICNLSALAKSSNIIAALAKNKLFSVNRRNWRVERLGNLGKAHGGAGFPVELQGQTQIGIPFIKVSDMNLIGNEKYIYAANNYIDERTAYKIRAKQFPAGSLVFPKVGAALLTNKRRLLTRPTCIDNNLMAINSTVLSPEFLYYWSLTVDLGKIVQVGALPSVNQSTVEALEVPVPSKKDQMEVVGYLSSIDRYHTTLQKARNALARQKQGLMQQLLTGKIRVKV